MRVPTISYLDSHIAKTSHMDIILSYYKGVTLLYFIKNIYSAITDANVDILEHLERDSWAGLEQFFKNNYYHRDIKPDNLYVYTKDGVYKILYLDITKYMIEYIYIYYELHDN